MDLENPDDSEFLDKISKYNNYKASEELDDFRNASDWMFKRCEVKKWVVYKRSKSLAVINN